MRSLTVVELDPSRHVPAGGLEVREVVQPDALFLERSEETLDQPVLLGRVGSDKLLVEPVEARRLPESLGLEDEPVI